MICRVSWWTQFGDTLVVQTQTMAMEKRLGSLVALLDELVRPAEIIVRNDASIRRLEGLPLEVKLGRAGRGSRAGCVLTASNTGSICKRPEERVLSGST